jgi:hypothetical protein
LEKPTGICILGEVAGAAFICFFSKPNSVLF